MNLGRPGYRMRVLLRCLLTFVLSAYPALIHAQQRFTALILRHANVISMSGEEVLPDRDVLIEGGVIQTISAERLKGGRHTLEIVASSLSGARLDPLEHRLAEVDGVHRRGSLCGRKRQESCTGSKVDNDISDLDASQLKHSVCEPSENGGRRDFLPATDASIP